MNKRRFFTYVVLVFVVLLFFNGTAAAHGTPVTAESTSTVCEKIPGNEWMTGTVLHVRNQVNVSIEESDYPLLNGVGEIVVNFDLDVATGDGHAWGTWVNESSTVDGSWVGGYRGVLKGFVLSNRSFAIGTGELANYRRLGTLNGYTEIPDPPSCGTPLEAESWTILLLEK